MQKAHALPLFYRTTTPTMVDNKRSYITITQNIEILSNIVNIVVQLKILMAHLYSILCINLRCQSLQIRKNTVYLPLE